jgi:required for meiotic nuclear division protein 1
MIALRPNGLKSFRRLAQIPPPLLTARTAFRGSESVAIRQLSSSRAWNKKQDVQNEPQKEKPPVSRPLAAKTSLRKVSMEAERSRIIVKGKGGRRFIDPDVDTKKITAYCAAEQYNIHTASRLIQADGYELDPYNTGLYPQVIHIQTEIRPPDPSKAREPEEQEHGDVFVFPSGTVVAWNVPERIALRLVERVLPPAALNSQSGSLEMEKEDLEYIEDPTREHSSIVGDTIILGTKVEPEEEASSREEGETSAAESDSQPPEVDTTLAKIAFSSGLARSTKLAVLERLTDAYFESTRTIPTIMSRGTPIPAKPYILRRSFEMLGLDSRLPFSRSFVLRKTGELLSIRAQLNLYSELTDSLPDLFWDSKHELGLEGYYDQVGKALDVGIRIHVLNDKLDYAQEIATLLRETLSERHGLRLEWMIIILIAIEVFFELEKRFKESKGSHDADSVEGLLKRYLEKAEQAEGAAKTVKTA